MELELCCETAACFDAVLSTTICQEETQEAIVPDACPDIMRILDTRAQAYLTGKQVRDGMVTVTGLVRASVFYLPDEPDAGVRCLPLTLPFACQCEAPGLSAQGSLLSVPRLRWAQARTLNPRKVLLRADLAIEINAYQPGELMLCCSAAPDPAHGIEQLVSEETTYMTTSVQEKPFTFSDRLELGNGAGSTAELLSLVGIPGCSECKLIGSKLIFKGDVELEGLVCDGGELRTVRQVMSFSQIMEISGAGEDCRGEVRVVLTDLSVQDGEVTLELLAQAVVRQRRTLSLLRDLYSTGWHTETTSKTYQLCHLKEDSVKTVAVRELLDTTTLVRSLCHSWAELGEIRTHTEGNDTVFTAEVQLNILYQDDGEQLQSVHKDVAVQCRLEAGGSTCRCWSSSPKELFVTPTAGGLEIRFSMEFHCFAVRQQQISGVASASLGAERQKGEGEQPSVILRLAAPGETLWDIAKAYATKAETIMQANGLEDGMVPQGKMLLIPRIR